MRLTKDEARILAFLIENGKYELNDIISDRCRKNEVVSITAFEHLEKRLTEYGDDKRRHGRTSMDCFSDALMRFVIASLKIGKWANNKLVRTK